MAPRYTPVALSDLHELIESFKLAPSQGGGTRSEVYFDWRLKPTNKGGPTLAIRLFSSVPANAEAARDCGEDAFRVCLVRSPGTPKAERILCVLPRVHRTQNWRDNLRTRLRLAWQLLTAEKCPACGARMYPERRKKNNELFWSCSRFPSCKGARRGPRGNTKLDRMIQKTEGG
jgi:hypothetical protein